MDSVNERLSELERVSVELLAISDEMAGLQYRHNCLAHHLDSLIRSNRNLMRGLGTECDDALQCIQKSYHEGNLALSKIEHLQASIVEYILEITTPIGPGSSIWDQSKLSQVLDRILE